MNNHLDFAVSMHLARINKNITSRRLAKDTGIDRQHILDIDKARAVPNAPTLHKLCEALELDSVEMLNKMMLMMNYYETKGIEMGSDYIP